MNKILAILRALINDIDIELNGNTEYSDDTLQRVITVAAIQVQSTITFNESYKINVLTIDIDPDPTDDIYCMFVAYKAAMIVIQGEVRDKSTKSIKIVDGPSSIDLTNSAKDLRSLLDHLTNQYETMRIDYVVNNNFGQVIITPTVVSYISPYEFS